ncbi:MAG: hypothetical protein HN576_08590 [Bacteriovoracaceae bacterium]|jgi:hypothetical protein|nr:hypothetical protein [Bacteriovoracaceae bacterium]
MKYLTILLSLYLQSEITLASNFEVCLFRVKILSCSDKIEGAGADLSLSTEFIPLQDLKKDESSNCNKLIGQKITRQLLFKSKQFIPFIKSGSSVIVDYSHFFIDINDPSLKMEVWKVVNIKTVRADHD